MKPRKVWEVQLVKEMTYTFDADECPTEDEAVEAAMTYWRTDEETFGPSVMMVSQHTTT